MKAIINLGTGPGEDNKIIVGERDYSNVTRSIELTASYDTSTTLHMTILLDKAFVSAEGELFINAEPVSDEVGEAIYKSLKQRYEFEEA